MRLRFSAPLGSLFDVSLRELAASSSPAVTTTLAENSGTPAPSDAGIFSIVSVNPNTSPATYLMYVRAPASLMTNPANFDILVVNKSQRTDRTDSAPMVVSLRARRIFRVTVAVTGDGHVTSSPPGIECGTAYSGRPLVKCSADFGPGRVTLGPNSNNDFDPDTPATVRFLGWSGNCEATVQTCELMLDGSGTSSAHAVFVATSSSETASNRPPAPVVSGWRWIGEPQCDPVAVPTGGTVHWDSQGHFCCSTGTSGNTSQRCGGLRETEVDCRNQPNMGINARLIHPGGCYELEAA